MEDELMLKIEGAITVSAIAILLVITFSLPISGQTGQTGQTGQIDKVEPIAPDLKPTITYKEKASYSEDALKNGLEGRVILDVVFAADGSLKDPKVFSGLPDGLTERAVEAAKKIKFEPATRDGKPVSVRGKLEFEFNLSKSSDESLAKKEGAAASETVHAISSSLRPTITYKEEARYTKEASDRNIYGTVILNVLFGADGKIGAIRVVSGLPYGLTESAIVATRAIRFEPAMKEGKPVSVRGALELSFSM
jgi:bla regulator protein blaR1